MYHHDVDFGITLSEIEDAQDFTPIPAGRYQVLANSVALKNTKLANGKYLQFEFAVISGDYVNRRIFQNVMIEHPNEDARRIGLQWLKSWIMACDGSENERLTLSFVSRFLHQPCYAVIDIEQGKAGYSDKNKIKCFNQQITD